jgi:hypothetical protein
MLDTVRYQVLAVLIAVIGGLVIAFATPANVDPRTQAIWGVVGALSSAIVLVLVIFLWNLFRAPYRQRNEVTERLTVREQEIARLTERRLLVCLPESRYDYLGQQWIRLRVENPTAIPIPECFGKLINYRLASWESRKEGRLLEEIEVSPESGAHTTPQSGELPPQRHMFPWSPNQLPETTITIPGHNSDEFLYIAMKRTTEGCFYTPTDMGLRYPNYGMGNFELELEIGSNSEPFKPTRVKLVFRAGGDLEAKKFELLPD